MIDKAISTSVITQQAKTLGQGLSNLTEAGLGKFGLQPQMLLDLGYLKPGIIDLANTSVKEALNLLTDPSLFTGKDGILTLTNILDSEKIQSDLVEQGMSLANDVLKQSGLLTGFENAADTATILGASMVAAPAEIVDFINNTGEALANQAIELTGKASQFATALAEGSGKEVIEAVTQAVSSATDISEVGTVIMDKVDNVADKLINNANIPTISLASDKIIGSVG